MAAIAFDIDGVFKAGRFFFPGGLKALATAKAAGVPVCFVTNGGGGLNEAEYLAGLKEKIQAAAPLEERESLSSALDSIGVESMILSYTPMGEDPQFREKRLLVIGDPKEKIKALCEGYGWRNFVHVSDYCEINSTVNPFAEALSTGKSHAAVVCPTGPQPAASPRGDLRYPSYLAPLVACD